MVAKSDPGPKLFRESTTRDSRPVECLGMTFESDEARRKHFLRRLKEKLPQLRRRPDFPVGEDEEILRLSDPPYYTACPNPFVNQFVEHYGRSYDPDEPYPGKFVRLSNRSQAGPDRRAKDVFGRGAW